MDLAWYIEAGKRLGNGELLAQLPELADIAAVRKSHSAACQARPWSTRTGSIWCARSTRSSIEDQADGIVITHGTNTLEETAYFLNLTLKTDRPVVIVGSMRPSSAISADGYLNVVNAVRVAADPASRGRGCLVVMNDTIFNGRDVTKNSTYRVQAFQSRDMGPLGFADADGKVVYYHRPARKHTVETEFDVRSAQSLPRVDVVLSYVGADGTMIEAAVKAGAKGIVSAATGAGRPTPLEDDAFDKAYAENKVAHVPVQPCRLRPRRPQSRPGQARLCRRATICNPGRRASCCRWRWRKPTTPTISSACSTPTDDSAKSR